MEDSCYDLTSTPEELEIMIKSENVNKKELHEQIKEEHDIRKRQELKKRLIIVNQRIAEYQLLLDSWKLGVCTLTGSMTQEVLDWYTHCKSITKQTE